VWVCFSWNGLGLLVILNGNLNTEGYKDILTRCILSMVEDQFDYDDCLYQHDSAPCHKARSVREWFVDSKFPEVDWPTQSPDVNPTEHLWGELERRLCSRYPMHHITNCSGYSSAGRLGYYSTGDIQTPGTKTPRQSWSCHKAKRVGPPGISVHD
jgi:hypothetical protein